MITFNPSNWYWFVGGDTSRVWSSAANAYLSAGDNGFVAWIDAGNAPSRVASEAELIDILAVRAPSITPTFPTALVAYAASVRYSKEVGGITISGIKVATDDRSKQMIMGARIAAAADSAFTTPWVGSDGNIVTLTATQVIAISDAVLAHVQTCFSTFATLVSGILGATVTSTAQIDAAFAAITT